MSTITITSPSNPPACLMGPLVSCSVTIDWDEPAFSHPVTYKVTFQLYDASGNQIGGSPIDFPIDEGDKYATVPFNVGANNYIGVTFVAKLMISNSNGGFDLVVSRSTSPYDILENCIESPTDIGNGGGGPIPTSTTSGIPQSTFTFSTRAIPNNYRYVYAVVERFLMSGADKTFVRVEHIEFADFYFASTPPRYQAEVPYFPKPFDPSTVYYCFFMFVDSEGTVVKTTDKLLMA